MSLERLTINTTTGQIDGATPEQSANFAEAREHVARFELLAKDAEARRLALGLPEPPALAPEIAQRANMMLFSGFTREEVEQFISEHSAAAPETQSSTIATAAPEGPTVGRYHPQTIDLARQVAQRDATKGSNAPESPVAVPSTVQGTPEAPTPQSAPQGSANGKDGLSRADLRYLELGGVHVDEGAAAVSEPIEIVRVDVDGQEPWWIRKLDAEGLLQVAAIAVDKEQKVFDVARHGDVRRLLTGLLFAGVVQGESNPEAFFETSAEAARQAFSTASKIVDANAVLYAALLKLNPVVAS